MSRPGFDLWGELWIVLCIILILVSGGIGELRVAVARNYWQLRVVHSLQRGGGQAALANQVSDLAARMDDDHRLNRLAGVSFLFAGDHERALEYLLHAQKTRASDCITLYWLGKTYEDLGDYANALVAMCQAGNTEYFPVTLASISDKELQDLVHEVMALPISTQARLELAKQVYGIDRDLAQQSFELAFQTAPEVLSHSLGVAWFYYDQRGFETAKIFGQRARSLFPEQPWVYVFWGSLNRATGDVDQAIQDLEYVADHFPTDEVAHIAHVELSRIYISREEYDVAIAHLEAANQIQEDPLSVYLLRSQAYGGLQKCTLAQEQLALARSLIKTEQQQDYYSFVEKTVRKDCP